MGAGQAERADSAIFGEPLRRYANTVAADMRLAHRGALMNGTLKAGNAIDTKPEVNNLTRSTPCLRLSAMQTSSSLTQIMWRYLTTCGTPKPIALPY